MISIKDDIDETDIKDKKSSEVKQNIKNYLIPPEKNILQQLVDDIKEGKTTVDDIAVNNPSVYRKYKRTLIRIEDVLLREKTRTEMTQGIWYYGLTNEEISNIALTEYPDYFLFKPKSNAHRCWNGYKGQKAVIINSFTGNSDFYHLLLGIVDKWPYDVPIRGRDRIPFTSEYVIIIASKRPEEIFHKIYKEDGNIAQLKRRFKVYELVKINNEIKAVEKIYKPSESEIVDPNDNNPHIYEKNGRYYIKVEHLIR
jgi:hypothetical protein